MPIIQIPVATNLIKFLPVGRCIYCGVSPPTAALTLEHIIPEGLGGRLELPQSSCHKCADRTKRFEGHVIGRMFGENRAHLGTRRKPGKKFGDALTVICDGKKIAIPRNMHPGILPMFTLHKPPGILLNPEPERRNWGNFSLALMPIVPDFEKRVASQAGRLTLAHSIDVVQFGQMLAKIAHGYAVAQLGLGNFKAFLTRSIRSKRPLTLPHYVGGSTIPWPRPKTNPLHLLSMGQVPHPSRDGRHLILVNVALYMPFELPTFDVVVGQATTATPQPQLDRYGKPSPPPA